MEYLDLHRSCLILVSVVIIPTDLNTWLPFSCLAVEKYTQIEDVLQLTTLFQVVDQNSFLEAALDVSYLFETMEDLVFRVGGKLFLLLFKFTEARLQWILRPHQQLHVGLQYHKLLCRCLTFDAHLSLMSKQHIWTLFTIKL